MQCIRDIIKHEGFWKGLYRSYPLTVGMNVPFASCVVCMNENMKTYFRPWEKQNKTFWYFLCAGLAGGCAGLITNPLDVVKTRLQTQEIKPSCERLLETWEVTKDKAKASMLKSLKKDCCDTPKQECSFEVKHNRYKDILTTTRYIYHHEGAIAFSKGVLPRLCINVPATALSWGTYEFVKGLLTKLD